MRIKALELNGFRAFARAQSIDLDADAVIIVGANGQGKTSIFDGILWALTGDVPRFDKSGLISKYSPSGQAHVAIELCGNSDESYRLRRSLDDGQERLLLEIDGRPVRDDAAKARLLEALWPEALLTADSSAALTGAITRSVYLQQDLVREFIEANSPRERFDAVSELIGVGRVTELQHELERAKAAWTRASNEQAKDIEFAERRLARLESALASLSSRQIGEAANLNEIWDQWWKVARRVGIVVEQVPLDSAEAPSALDSAVKELAALRHAQERRLDSATELISDLKARATALMPIERELDRKLRAAQRDIAMARKALSDAENRAASRRQAQVAQREKVEELRAIAQLALRHLEDRCPVCAQVHDKAKTRRRLEDLTAGADTYEVVDAQEEDVTRLSADLADKEREETECRQRLQEAQQAGRELRAWTEELRRRLTELDLDLDLDAEADGKVQEFISQLRQMSGALASHQEEGERLALSLTRASEQARRKELESETTAARQEVAKLGETIGSRTRTGDLAGEIIEALRAAASDVVSRDLKRIEPLLSRIYARIDPHPAFRSVEFLTEREHGRGRMSTVIGDPIENISIASPETVLSSSQMNALAVAVFLTLNLGVARLPLETAMLDDPLQSLDDVNLLGLVDLLRRTKDVRQLIVSTHDARFGKLLARKLRPISKSQRTILIELEGWAREGPLIKHTDIPADATPLRIAV
jgi:DNA repair exonuclease SbcCD ATPase subunit